MSPRVVGGEFGGRVLACPSGKAVRPVMGRVKNAVFNILGERTTGARVLDLYAGCGSFGIEALSRGAAAAAFVERERRHADVLRGNLEKLGLASRSRVMAMENREALRLLEAEGASFDLVLADPPYGPDRHRIPPGVALDLEALAASPAWAPGGLLVLDHRAGRPPLPPSLEPWLSDRRDYGDATVAFFGKPA